MRKGFSRFMASSRISSRLLGLLFFLIAVGFLVWFGLDHIETMPALDWRSQRVLWAIGAGAALYLLGLAVMAYSWRVLLNGFGERPYRLHAEIIDLSTQAAKYIPGNVAHLVGRVALAKAAGYSVTRSTAALLVEHALAGYMAVLLVGVGILATPNAYAAVAGYLPPKPLLVALLGLGVALPFAMGPVNRVVGERMPEKVQEVGRRLEQLRKRDVAWCLVLTTVFFCLGGAVLVHAAQAALGESIEAIPAIVLFAAAWVAGTSTPGAPGGLGVREAVLSLGLTPVIGGGPALAVALVTRLITLLADLSASLIGLAGLRLAGLRRPEKPASN